MTGTQQHVCADTYTCTHTHTQHKYTYGASLPNIPDGTTDLQPLASLAMTGGMHGRPPPEKANSHTPTPTPTAAEKPQETSSVTEAPHSQQRESRVAGAGQREAWGGHAHLHSWHSANAQPRAGRQKGAVGRQQPQPRPRPREGPGAGSPRWAAWCRRSSGVLGPDVMAGSHSGAAGGGGCRPGLGRPGWAPGLPA